MKKIRYMIALSNIKPTGAQKENMATALLRGVYDKDRRAGMSTGLANAARIVIIALIVAAAGFGVYKIATFKPAPPAAETAETEETGPADEPASDGFNTLITPIYEGSDYETTYGLLREVIPLTKVTKRGSDADMTVNVTDAETLTALFNCKKSDLSDIIMSLFAFAEPGWIIDLAGSGDGYRRTEIIIASEKRGTFEYIVSFPAVIQNDFIYLDIGTLLFSSTANPEYSRYYSMPEEDRLTSSLVKAGRILETSGKNVSSYIINPDLLFRVNVSKIRIEGGLPVTYERQIKSISFEHGSSPYTQGTDLTVRETVVTAGSGEHYYAVIDIESESEPVKFSYTPEVKSTAAIRSSTGGTAVISQYFPSPPQDMRGKICNIINKSGCDWFMYLYTEQRTHKLDSGEKVTVEDPVGIALYGDDYSIKDSGGRVMNAYFNPYFNLFPMFDLNDGKVFPDIVTARDYTTFEYASTGFAAPPADVMEEYEKNCLKYYYNEKFFLHNSDIFAVSTCFSADLYGSGGSIYSKDAVIADSAALLGQLGLSYAERFYDTAGAGNFSDPTGGIKTYAESVYGRSIYASSVPMMIVSGPQSYDFVLTGSDAALYIETKTGMKYRIDKLYGYRLLKSGFITDLNNVVIGFYDTEAGLKFFREPSAPLYVISNNGDLLYIGQEMPDCSDTYLPFDSVDFYVKDGERVTFRLGYLGYFLGPYVVADSCSLVAKGDDTELRVYVYDPQYSKYPYLKYDEKTQTYNKIRVGKSGDRFVVTCGGYSYRTELAHAGNRRTKPVYLQYDGGYYK